MIRFARQRIRSLAVGVAAVGIVLASALTPASAGAARVDSFTGYCTISATAAASPGEPLQQVRTRTEGSGTCTGILNGQPVSNAPVRARATGTGVGVVTGPVFAPLLGSGAGSITFRDHHATIGFHYQQAALLLLLTGNDGGNAVGALEPFTEGQPQQPRAVAVRIIATAVNMRG